MNNNTDIKQTLIELNRKTLDYNIPLDGGVAFGIMFAMNYLDFKPFPTIITGAIIHGILHPIISTAK